MKEESHSTILLSLDNQTIIEFVVQDTSLGLWRNLKALCMTKSINDKQITLKITLTQPSYVVSGTLSLRDHLQNVTLFYLIYLI